MKKHLFPLFLLLIGANASAQQDFFALVGKETPNIIFNDFRAIDPAMVIQVRKFLRQIPLQEFFHKPEMALLPKIKIPTTTHRP